MRYVGDFADGADAVYGLVLELSYYAYSHNFYFGSNEAEQAKVQKKIYLQVKPYVL